MIGRLIGGMLGVMALMGGGILVVTVIGTNYLNEAARDTTNPAGLAWMGILWVGGPIIVITIVGLLASRWLFGRVLTGDTKLMTTGTPATGVVKAVRDTGTTINDVNAIFEVVMDVTVPGKPPYEGKAQIMVNRTQWGDLRPGLKLSLRVDPADPSKIAVVSDDAAATGPIIQAPGMDGPRRVEGTRSADDIIRDGVRAEAVILGVSDTGKTVADLAPGQYPPERAGDPVVYATFRVEPDGEAPFTAEGIYRAPRDRLADLSIGARVPVAWIPGDQSSATFDWDRF